MYLIMQAAAFEVEVTVLRCHLEMPSSGEIFESWKLRLLLQAWLTHGLDYACIPGLKETRLS